MLSCFCAFTHQNWCERQCESKN
ncbi:hypothetical protein Nmel_000540 [Mimus melanotis]